jgi:hypothetical protein
MRSKVLPAQPHTVPGVRYEVCMYRRLCILSRA